jgi:hypothetical protein
MRLKMILACSISLEDEDARSRCVQEGLFSFSKLDDFVPSDHPLRLIRTLVDQSPKRLFEFDVEPHQQQALSEAIQRLVDEIVSRQPASSRRTWHLSTDGRKVLRQQ